MKRRPVFERDARRACIETITVSRPVPLLLAISLIWSASVALVPVRPAHAQASNVTLTPVGDPSWGLFDFHTFSAPVGPPPDYEGFSSTIDSLRGGPFEDPRSPPFDQILSDGVAANGFQEQTVFSLQENDGNPDAVYIIFSVIPDGDFVGSSPQIDSAPIIPQDLLPLACGLELLREGVAIDSCHLELDVADEFDGASWFPFFTAWPPQFWLEGTPRVGDFELAGTLLDGSGAGYEISAQYSVVPEPSTAALAAAGFCGCLLLVRRRRWRH